jgi:hypothetical protein
MRAQIGVAIIAFGTLEKHNISVPIVPIGLSYFRGHRFRLVLYIALLLLLVLVLVHNTYSYMCRYNSLTLASANRMLCAYGLCYSTYVRVVYCIAGYQ